MSIFCSTLDLRLQKITSVAYFNLKQYFEKICTCKRSLLPSQTNLYDTTEKKQSTRIFCSLYLLPWWLGINSTSAWPTFVGFRQCRTKLLVGLKENLTQLPLVVEIKLVTLFETHRYHFHRNYSGNCLNKILKLALIQIKRIYIIFLREFFRRELLSRFLKNGKCLQSL